MHQFRCFNQIEIQVVNQSVELAEELVSDHYKLSTSQLLRLNYDVKTLQELSSDEIVADHFAQIVRYAAKKRGALLDTSVKDFYKVCLQDHAIVSALNQNSQLNLMAFVLYIVSHELIHIIRFRNFLQHFDASVNERLAEEIRVHAKTHEVLSGITLEGLNPVLSFYENWRSPPHDIMNS
ncbi:MAG: hypothetical protein MUE70_08235 [Desulfobacterales bacterium]|jgi:hypothetical protein|nr:hypothetical protein [Desulfobacterales bacterium]